MVARGFSRGTGRGAADRRRPGGLRLAGLAVTALGALVVLTGCDIGDRFAGFGWPTHGITEQSEKMYDLWVGSVVAALAVGAFVWGLIFWCVVRYRKSGDELPAQTRFNLPIELLYTVLPLLVISVLFYYTAVTETYVDKTSANPDMKVEVVGFKWNWQFRYLEYNGKDAAGNAIPTTGADGQPISTIGASDYVPVLVVPTDRRILFLENSRDVIHSFWVPNLLFKRDVFPGNVTNRFEVTIKQPGAYVGRCAELCGAYHSMMNFEMRVVSPDQFDRYMQARRDGKSTPEALASIGQSPLATTTKPFKTDPAQRSAS